MGEQQTLSLALRNCAFGALSSTALPRLVSPRLVSHTMALQRLLPALARPLQHTSPALLQPLCRCFTNSSTALASSSRLAPAPTPSTLSAVSPPTSPSTQLQERKKGPGRTPPKNRQRPPLAKLNEQEVQEEFLRGTSTSPPFFLSFPCSRARSLSPLLTSARPRRQRSRRTSHQQIFHPSLAPARPHGCEGQSAGDEE